MASRAAASSLCFVVWALAGCGQPEEERIGSVALADTAPVCAAGETLEGIDVSHWQEPIDWDQVATSGIAFAFIKATEHTSYVDPTLDDNWTAIQQHGLIGGAYHFFHSDLDPIEQADHFLANVQGLAGNLLPVLDLETADGESEATIEARAVQWLEHVAAQTGKTPILYTSSSFLSDFSAFSPYTLWVANWDVACPKVPDAWPTWSFWQYSDMGDIPGIQTDVDLNQFNGSLADLEALAGVGNSSTGAGGAGGSGTDTTTSGAGATGGAEPESTSTGNGAGTGGEDAVGSGGGGAVETLAADSNESSGGCSSTSGKRDGLAGLLAVLALLLSQRRFARA